MNYRYIAIEGNIGAGKTTLAHMLSKDLGSMIILEQFADNQFLSRFYEEPQKYAFQLETSFLIDRFHQLKKDLNDITATYISDYYFAKGLIFAEINLPADQFELFKKLHLTFADQLPEPDLIIYLYHPVSDLQKNIIERGRSYELQISETYLSAIEGAYDAFFKNIDHIPVLRINLSDLDFIRKKSVYTEIWKLTLKEWPAGINYIEIDQ